MHQTVLLREAVDALVTDPAGFYVDGTFGRGGHSAEILARLAPEGRLLALDRDPVAVAVGRERFAGDPRFEIAQGPFSELGVRVQERGLQGRVCGILLDIGVSSPQLDEAERGFSFLRDGPLDMRMDPTRGESAAQWLARASEEEIARVLKEYGEERFARRIARAIVLRRAEQPFERTLDLAKVVSDANPAWEKGKNPATRPFQAIRIHVNDELGELARALERSVEVLAPGGRLAVISFHSLEDRMVKRFIRDHERGPVLPRHLPVPASALAPKLRGVGKAIQPGAEEIEENPRARSAVLRVAVKS